MLFRHMAYAIAGVDVLLNAVGFLRDDWLMRLWRLWMGVNGRPRMDFGA